MQLDVVGPGTVTSKSSRLKLMEFCFFQLVCLSSSKHNNPHIACSTDSNMRYRMVVRLILQPGMLVSLKKKKTWKNSLIYLDWWTERAMFLQSCQLFGAVNFYMSVVLCERKALDFLSPTLNPTCSAVESGCLLSAVVFHHVHSPFWHAY